MDSDNIIYYDLALINREGPAIEAMISDQRASDIISNPSEYEMSIVRFRISSNLIPLFFPIIPNPAFPLQTNMSITLRYAGVDFQRFINVTPEEAKEGVRDYTQYLNALNTASNSAFIALKAIYPAADGTFAPRFYLEESSGIISCYTQDTYLSYNPNRIAVAFNQPLQAILDFPCLDRYSVPQPQGFEFELAITENSTLMSASPRIGLPIFLNLVTGNLIKTSQEFACLNEWSSIRSIIFTSQALPVVKEYVPNSNVTQYQSNSVNNSSKPIVTDFLTNDSSVDVSRNTYTYLPTAEYRMMSLQGNKSLSSIDIQAYYQTYDGIVRPIYISAGHSWTVKVMFRRIHKL